jgi:hypothetical protein
MPKHSLMATPPCHAAGQGNPAAPAFSCHTKLPTKADLLYNARLPNGPVHSSRMTLRTDRQSGR